LVCHLSTYQPTYLSINLYNLIQSNPILSYPILCIYLSIDQCRQLLDLNADAAGVGIVNQLNSVPRAVALRSRTWEICERSAVAYFCSRILSIWAWLEETSVCLFACLFVYLSICLSIANLSILYLVSIVWFLPVSVILSIKSYVSIFVSNMFYLPFISYIVHLSWLPFISDTSSILSTISISSTWLMAICILHVLSILAISSIFYSWSRWSAVSILYCFYLIYLIYRIYHIMIYLIYLIYPVNLIYLTYFFYIICLMNLVYLANLSFTLYLFYSDLVLSHLSNLFCSNLFYSILFKTNLV
jgi:hypothetical protein